MKWTRERPSKEGWYFWAKTRRSHFSTWYPWVVVDKNGKLRFYLDNNLNVPLDGGWWAGPIELPEE